MKVRYLNGLGKIDPLRFLRGVEVIFKTKCYYIVWEWHGSNLLYKLRNFKIKQASWKNK